MKPLPLFVTALLLPLLTSCGLLQLGGLNPVSRPPAASAILVHRDLNQKQLGAITTYPAGRYAPKYQDSAGTFFEAPEKPYVFDTLVNRKTTMPNAGLYVRDDQEGGVHVWNLGGEVVFKRSLSKFKTTEPPLLDVVR
jgi:hypothetical protein